MFQCNRNSNLKPKMAFTIQYGGFLDGYPLKKKTKPGIIVRTFKFYGLGTIMLYCQFKDSITNQLNS